MTEYTDWQSPTQHPASIRDKTLEALNDAQYVAPLVEVIWYYVYTVHLSIFDFKNGLISHDDKEHLSVIGQKFVFISNPRKFLLLKIMSNKSFQMFTPYIVVSYLT